jgi:hypothetical protein
MCSPSVAREILKHGLGTSTSPVVRFGLVRTLADLDPATVELAGDSTSAANLLTRFTVP